jgi:hypothetical protein
MMHAPVHNVHKNDMQVFKLLPALACMQVLLYCAVVHMLRLPVHAHNGVLALLKVIDEQLHDSVLANRKE